MLNELPVEYRQRVRGARRYEIIVVDFHRPFY
jgi:hypothetical protein